MAIQGNKSVFTFQDTTSGTPNTAVAFSPGVAERWLFQADPANTDSVFVGTPTNQFIELVAGQSLEMEIDDPSLMSHKSPTASQKINVLGVQ